MSTSETCLPVRVRLLGTGGPRPDPERAGPATLVQVGDENLLFDTGRGVVVQMVRAGIDLASLKHVFLTHHHFDHVSEIPLVTGHWPDIEILISPKEHDLVDDVTGTIEPGIAAPVRVAVGNDVVTGRDRFFVLLGVGGAATLRMRGGS